MCVCTIWATNDAQKTPTDLVSKCRQTFRSGGIFVGGGYLEKFFADQHTEQPMAVSAVLPLVFLLVCWQQGCLSVFVLAFCVGVLVCTIYSMYNMQQPDILYTLSHSPGPLNAAGSSDRCKGKIW